MEYVSYHYTITTFNIFQLCGSVLRDAEIMQQKQKKAAEKPPEKK